MSKIVADNISPRGSDVTIAGVGTFSSSGANLTGIVTASSGFVGNVTGTASTATASATAYGLSGSPTLSGITSVSTTNLTVNGNAYPATGPLSNRNKIINGKLQVDQYDVSVTADNFFVDRWKYSADSSSKATVQKDNQSPVGFQKSIFVTSSSAYSVPSGETYKIRHCIEGHNIVDLLFGTANAKSITLSFYVRSSLTGTFGGALRNSGGSRSYPFTYSISSANTWEYKTIIIPGDTSGTWNGGNGIGIEIDFGLAVGSTYSGTAGAWAGANYVSATGATSVLATNAATWYLTGVQLEVGSVATPFEHVNFGNDLARCQRYYQRFNNSSTIAVGVVGSSTAAFFDLKFIQTMRAAPSLTVNTLGSIVKEGINWYPNSSITASTADENQVTLSTTQSNNTMGSTNATRLGNGTDLTFSAEL
jgi:hypothetical protein